MLYCDTFALWVARGAMRWPIQASADVWLPTEATSNAFFLLVIQVTRASYSLCSGAVTVRGRRLRWRSAAVCARFAVFFSLVSCLFAIKIV